MLSRRAFLKTSLAAGGGLLLTMSLPSSLNRVAQGQTGAASMLTAFIEISPDNRVTLIIPKVEFGQGVYTSLAMLLAEELEVGLDQVSLRTAPPNEKLYADPLLHFQATGGSTSVRGAWQPLRIAGATARTLLIAAAARSWGVDPATCQVEQGVVIHRASGRKQSYGRLARAAAALPLPENVPLKAPRDFKIIGRTVPRLDTPDKANGRTQYTIDLRVPGMKIATVRICPVFGGKLARVDPEPALKVRGVTQVVPLEDAVAVVADHMWAAMEGARALDIVWDEGPHAAVSTATVVDQLRTAAEKDGLIARREGDPARALQSADTTLEAEYTAPFLAHGAMEPISCLVHVRENECEIWAGTQVPARAVEVAARHTGLSPDRIILHGQIIGGAYGRRLEVDDVDMAVRIAKQVPTPVKMVWTREEDTRHDWYRPYYFDRLSAGLDAEGLPVAWTHRIVGSSVMARFAPPALRKDGLDPDAIDGAETLPYDIPNLRVDYVRQEPPGIPTSFWRGVGPTHNIFVVESFIDELAAAAKRDPVDYRRALLRKSPRALGALNLAAEKAGWGRPLRAGVGRGVAIQYAFDSYLALIMEVSVSPDGVVHMHRGVCAVDCGLSVHPGGVMAQIEGGIIFGLSAALFGHITIDRGRVTQSNFHDYRVLRINETPQLEVHLVASTAPPGGIGETGTVVAAPALANAVFAATGRRIRNLPIADQLSARRPS